MVATRRVPITDARWVFLSLLCGSDAARKTSGAGHDLPFSFNFDLFVWIAF